MSRRSKEIFATIRTEGAILPADLLRRIADGDKGIEGLGAEDYHLSKGEKLSEAVNRSWSRLLGAWKAFRAAAETLPGADAGTTVTRERWLLPLFQELGYGRLLGSKAQEIGGKTYPVSHLWHRTPIHLVGNRVDLDHRTAGVAGAARTSPHGLVQELLNRSEDYLWGLVSNGFKLRILRDNASLTRQAYVEFDLETLMDGEAFADFALLWVLCHQSRVEAEKPEECWLEKWSKAAQDEGARALDKQDYYRELLRLVYRLIFLFVAEDRGLLLDPESGVSARERYLRFYSTRRLRDLAGRQRGSRHADLYEGVRVVGSKLGDPEGCPSLGLKPLGSFLWSEAATPHLGGQIANGYFLDALRALAYRLADGSLRPVDYKNLRSEELGSVYEALLELHPEVNVDAATFVLKTLGGHERKTSGSYYTADCLVQTCLDVALEPVIRQKLEEAVRLSKGRPEDVYRLLAEKALLSLRVCDPACGSGHFLIASGHRIAKHLAAVRTGDEEPAPEAYRQALRDVIGHCLYGVDINPMAVELCKVALWMEALEPGKPLSFLDSHVQCGNALIGATPALMAKGIPDEAFEAVEGDEKEAARRLRKQNSDDRRGQMTLFAGMAAETPLSYGGLTSQAERVESEPDADIRALRQKEEDWAHLIRSDDFQRRKFLADAWCSGFFWPKREGALEAAAVTQGLWLRLQRDPASAPRATRDEVQRLARHHAFFHWHLAFPQVFRPSSDKDSPKGWEGGFDVFLGNPPWDTLSPDVKEFFSAFDPDVRFQDRTGQDAIVAKLLEDPVIAARWEDHRRQLYTEVHFYKDSGIYVLFAPGNLGKGDFNIYRMFVELALGKVGHNGRACQVVPSGLYNGANCAAIREFLLNETCLESMFGFSNTSQVWFKGINVTTRFCIYTARVPGKTSALKAAFAIDTQEKLRAVSAGSTLSLPAHLIRTFSPDALSILELNSQLDISVAEKMYSRYPGFGNKSSGPPRRQYMRELDMGNDRELFCAEQNGLPIYEGRMVSQYDHRAKGYRAGRGRSADWEELPFSDLEKSVQPQWWIQIDRIPSKLRNRLNKYRIGFCDVAYPDTERSFISAILPSGCVAGHKVPTITFEDGSEWIYLVWLSVANSFSMDWLVRKQIKLTVSYTIVDSLPFPHPRLGDHAVGLLCPLALRLSCTGPEMIDYWNQMAKYGWAAPVPEGTTPPGYFDDEDRLLARAKIESIVARDLYGITKDELSYILDTFPIVERRDRQRYGDYRTKLLVLEMYDRLEQGLDLGIPAPAKPPPTQSPALAAQRLQPAPFPEPTRKPLQAHFELTPPPPRPTRPGPVSPGAAAAPPAPTRPTAAAPLTQALDYLKTHPGPRSRADLMGALEIDASDWITLARQLAEHEDVEKTGEKRGTRYAWKAP